MPSFLDNQERKWDVSVNLATVSLVHTETGVSIYKLFEDTGKPYQELLGNLPVFANVLYLICRKQAESYGLDEYAFLEAIYGESFEKAKDAFDEALVLFFPEPQKGLVKKLLDAGKKVQMRLTTQAMTELSALDTDKMVDQAVRSILATINTKPKSGKKQGPLGLSH